MDFMQIAIKEGVEGVENGHGGPFGAVIVKDGKVVGSAHNKVGTDDLLHLYKAKTIYKSIFNISFS